MPRRPAREEFAGNYIDASRIRAYAKRVGSRIPAPEARDRFVRVSFDALRDDPRNARPAAPSELAHAPDWALRDHLLGKPVYAFNPDPDSVAVIKAAARALRETCAEVAFYTTVEKGGLSTRQRVVRQMAKEFLAKISRMPFTVIAQKAHWFQVERARRLDDLKADEILFSREEIFTAPGRRWARVRSVGELGALGRELHNCLADGSAQHKRYARALRADSASFWVLRDYLGIALMAAMIDTITGRVREVRGPRNAFVNADDADFASLTSARASSLSGTSGLILPLRRRAAY